MAFAAGILGCELYVPNLFIEQSDLEKHDERQAELASAEGLSSEGSSRGSSVDSASSSASMTRWRGKYTKGLGQRRMAFVSDREDVCSLALTVVSRLLHSWSVDKSEIGVIYVARETVLDHSKSIKSVLMQLFSKNPAEISEQRRSSFDEERMHSEIGGCDMLHACYSGTEALSACVNWAESRSECSVRKYAVMVCADIAEYCTRATRPTGGAGAVAFLIGKELNGCGPMLKLGKVQGSYSAHGYDFYKPTLASPYPTVDGRVSNEFYLRSLDECYESLVSHYESDSPSHTAHSTTHPNSRRCKSTGFRVNDLDYYVFHSPYNKLVEKSFARLVYNDFCRNPNDERYERMKQFRDVQPRSVESTQRELVRGFTQFCKSDFCNKVESSTVLSKEVGNCYTASLWMGLLSLLAKEDCSLTGCRIGCFSYGSGVCSALFVLNVCDDSSQNTNLKRARSIARRRVVDVCERRKQTSVEDYCTLMTLRERIYGQIAVGLTAEIPGVCDPRETVEKDVYFLDRVDVKGRRVYAVQKDDPLPSLDHSLSLIDSWFESQSTAVFEAPINRASVFESHRKSAENRNSSALSDKSSFKLSTHLLFALAGAALGLLIGLSVSPRLAAPADSDCNSAK